MRTKRKSWLCAILALLAFLTYPSCVHAQTEDHSSQDSPLAPYFVIQSENAVLERFPLKETKVTTNIDGIIEKEIGLVFMEVLEDAGVYKRTPEGQAAFDRFLQSL